MCCLFVFVIYVPWRAPLAQQVHFPRLAPPPPGYGPRSPGPTGDGGMNPPVGARRACALLPSSRFSRPLLVLVFLTLLSSLPSHAHQHEQITRWSLEKNSLSLSLSLCLLSLSLSICLLSLPALSACSLCLLSPPALSSVPSPILSLPCPDAVLSI